MNSPFNESTADFAASDVLAAAGGVVEIVFDAGGVVPEAGVFELVVVSPSGSAECWRLSCSVCQYCIQAVCVFLRLCPTYSYLAHAFSELSLTSDIIRR